MKSRFMFIRSLGRKLWSVPVFVLLFPVIGEAASYTFSGSSMPTCTGGSWSSSGSTHTCSGSMTLAAGDSILPSAAITIKTEAGVLLSGNNTLGTGSVSVNLENNYGGLQAAGTSYIYGNIKNTSGNLQLSGTTVSGTVSNSNGGITLNGGSVQGLVSSGCCAVSSTNTNLSGGASSPSNTITITGGTISGNFSTSGGSGIILNGVTMQSGNITGTNVAVTVTNSTLGTGALPVAIIGNGINLTNVSMPNGSLNTATTPINVTNSSLGTPDSTVSITSGNVVTLKSSTTVYGNVTAGNWNSALDIQDTSAVYGTCSPSHPKCTPSTCSSSRGSFYINEANTKDNWVEIYAKNQVAFSNWTLTACSLEKQGNNFNQVCETKTFSYSPAADGQFVVISFSLGFHDKLADYLLKDNTGKLVDYFRVGMELNAHPLQLATAQQCQLANSCNILQRSNNGQRNFFRTNDGDCGWDDSTWNDKDKVTKDDSNTGTPPPPQVLSITRNQPENAFAGSNVSWTITFSEAVTGVDAADFQLLPNLGVAGHSIVSVTGSGTTWQVTAYTGNGTGTLGLNLVDNDTILSGTTPLGGAGNNNGNFVGQVYIIALTCITDDFNRTALGDDWSVTSKSGSFGSPRIFSNRLRLTNNTGNVATSSTFQKKFPAADNQVTLEFDFFAYGGSAADGISVVFSDALITPEPGGYGGSLGYANRSGVSGFAGGWLGIGLDTFGNYSNPTESRRGGPGSRKNAVAMRGSGVGQTAGYSYISGTDTLTSTLRSSTGHRYRVSIDSRVAGQAMVKVERNTGSGFTTLIDTINVLSQTGQAAVPENLLLTLTGSTGGSNDNHEIDNVQICAVKMNPISNAIHHFRIEHDGNGLTCAPEAVKIIACANNDCSQRYQGNVQITHNNGTFNFSGGEGTFYLSRTTPGTITIGISSSTPSAANTLRCTNTSGGSNACELIFSDVGIQLDGDAAAGKTPIATQIAGKPSNIGLNAATQKIRVVKTDTQTGACIPALQNQTRSVNFRYPLPSVPAEGLNDASFFITGIVTGTTSNTLTAANAQKNVQLFFDDTGSASFSFTPSDAGRYILRADMTIPVVDSNNNPTGTTLSRNDSSLEFVVRPLAVFADASGKPKALDHSGAVFKKAGEAFDLTFSTTRWETAADDNNSDGIWDKCQATTLALPGITRVPAWLLGKPAPELVAPDPGTGNLTYGDGDTSFSAKSSSATASNVNFSDVGIIQFRGQSTFLGENVSVCSPYIGRFIPDHFKVEVTAPLTTCPTSDCPSPSGGAAYAGQGFITKVTALNRAGGTTSNYQGDFDRAIALTAHTAKGGSTAATGGTLSNNTATDFTAGSVTLNNVQYAFTSLPGAPINIHLRANESAGDSVSSLRTAPAAASDSIEDGIKIIQGRLRLGNAFGTVQRPPTMDVRTQYWSGNSWVKWADGTTNLSSSLFSINPNLATLALTSNGGLGPWSIAFTGASKGSAVVSADLSLTPWLRVPDPADPSTLIDPKGKVTFGVYPAESKKTVHTRELY